MVGRTASEYRILGSLGGSGTDVVHLGWRSALEWFNPGMLEPIHGSETVPNYRSSGNYHQE